MIMESKINKTILGVPTAGANAVASPSTHPSSYFAPVRRAAAVDQTYHSTKLGQPSRY